MCGKVKSVINMISVQAKRTSVWFTQLCRVSQNEFGQFILRHKNKSGHGSSANGVAFTRVVFTMQALLALLVSWLPVVSWCSDCSYALPQNVVGNSHYACVQLLGRPDNATFIDPDTWMELDLRFPAQSSATSSSPAHIYELPPPAGFSGHGSSANGVAFTRVVFTMQALLALLVSWLPVVSWCSDCSYALPQNVVGNSHYACVQLLGRPDNATFIDPDTWMELDLRFPAQSSATSSSPAHIYELPPPPAGFSGHGSSANGVAFTRVVFTMQTCPEAKPGVLNLHVVPYWRLDASDTFESLYENWAKPTLSAVVDELSPNSPRRFSFDQVAFVARWWQEQNVSSRTRMRRLVDSGRLEPLGGGWVQPDEASCHYSALVDQLTLGMRWLQENLGDCGRPRAAWQLDTWGHSVELASLLSQAGLHGLFLSRLPENVASHFIWKADASLGEAGEIFTATARRGWPKGYCFDADCPKDKLTVANAVGRAEQLIRRVASQTRKTNQALISMGGDYQSAAYTYENIDTLIRYINAKHQHLPKVHAFYSTPSCYLRSLLETNEAWTEVDEDLFPYTDGVHPPRQAAYWTGYFSSEPNFKRTVRRANGVLQACKQLSVLGFVHSKDIRVFQENVALAQNSEVIAGCERPEVLLQYEALLNNGIARCQRVMDEALRAVVWEGNSVSQLRFSHCLEDDCKPVDADEAWLLVYNPLAYAYTTHIRLPAKEGYSYVVDGLNAQILSAENKADEVVFSARLVPLGVTTHYVQRSRESPSKKPEASPRDEQPNKMTVIRNKRYRLVVDSATGFVRGIMVKGGLQVTLQHLFLSYHAYQGSSRKASDSRVLNPVNDDPFDLGNNVTFRITRGLEVQELHQRYAPWLDLVVRLFENEDTIEFEWSLGPVPLGDHKGKEIVCRFASSVQSGELFYTDTNGRRSIERKRLEGSPVASNFYPVTSWAFLASESQGVQLTVFPDRPQGAASLASGNLEFLIQRRLIGGRGVPVRGRHWLHIGTIADSQRLLKNQDIYHILETSLGSTQDKAEMVRFVWRRGSGQLPAVSQEQRMRVWLKRGYHPRFEDTVVLHPGEIRTFVGRTEKVRPLPES
ncbi:lysosomal alpha-mannosidase isoform X4 [Rhipicephalus microplus]|uniref:lysosomal alpha-mannosidase isoform X4 n=1 Tax=Rhipicephalus microplus TaxID=6941 RepID=UPI003F6C217E